MFTGLIRTIILYILIIAGIRLMGKRQVGELEPSELVLSLIIADLAAVPMQDFGIPLLTGVIPILALLAMTMILSVLTMKSIRFRALLCGRPSVVIRRGEIDQREMRRNRLTVDELLEELRSQGYTDPQKVEYAILETSGQLSVLPRAAEKPPTMKQLGLEAQESGLPLVLISDGRLLERNLRARGYDGRWLDKQLEQAQELAARGDWEGAARLSRESFGLWQAHDAYLHVMMRHSDTDQILRGFRAVEQYLVLEEPDQYTAANAELICQLELLSEMEQPSLVNIL